MQKYWDADHSDLRNDDRFGNASLFRLLTRSSLQSSLIPLSFQRERGIELYQYIHTTMHAATGLANATAYVHRNATMLDISHG